VSKLQVHRRKYKTRFNANVHTIAEKLTVLDERIADANVSCVSLAKQLDNATNLHVAVEAIQDKINTLTTRDASANRAEVPLDADDIKASIGSLNALVKSPSLFLLYSTGI